MIAVADRHPPLAPPPRGGKRLPITWVLLASLTMARGARAWDDAPGGAGQLERAVRAAREARSAELPAAVEQVRRLVERAPPPTAATNAATPPALTGPAAGSQPSATSADTTSPPTPDAELADASEKLRRVARRLAATEEEASRDLAAQLERLEEVLRKLAPAKRQPLPPAPPPRREGGPEPPTAGGTEGKDHEAGAPDRSPGATEAPREPAGEDNASSVVFERCTHASPWTAILSSVRALLRTTGSTLLGWDAALGALELPAAEGEVVKAGAEVASGTEGGAP